MALFNHVQIKVKSLNASKSFYDGIMSVLGYKEVLNIKDVVIGYGTDVHDMFEIRQNNASEAPLSSNIHIAFNAKSPKDVDSFYKTSIKLGAKCNGKPGPRPEYEEGYYAAFIIDPDGHNIEAVYSSAREAHDK